MEKVVLFLWVPASLKLFIYLNWGIWQRTLKNVFPVLLTQENVTRSAKGVLGKYLCFLTNHSSLHFQRHTAVHHTLKRMGTKQYLPSGPRLRKWKLRPYLSGSNCNWHSKLMCWHRLDTNSPWIRTVCLLDPIPVEDSVTIVLQSQLSCVNSTQPKTIKLGRTQYDVCTLGVN